MRYPSWTPGQSITPLQKYQADQIITATGTDKKPSPPQSLTAQGGARKVLVTWELPAYFKDIVGWNIYKGTEAQKIDSIRDPNTRQYSVPSDSGSSPPTINVFVSSFNAAGVESQKVQVQGAALAEASAPTDPTPPSGSSSSGDTGSTSTTTSGSGGFIVINGRGFTQN